MYAVQPPPPPPTAAETLLSRELLSNGRNKDGVEKINMTVKVENDNDSNTGMDSVDSGGLTPPYFIRSYLSQHNRFVSFGSPKRSINSSKAQHKRVGELCPNSDRTVRLQFPLGVELEPVTYEIGCRISAFASCRNGELGNAERSGIVKEGDVIVKVDDIHTLSMRFSHILAIIDEKFASIETKSKGTRKSKPTPVTSEKNDHDVDKESIVLVLRNVSRNEREILVPDSPIKKQIQKPEGKSSLGKLSSGNTIETNILSANTSSMQVLESSDINTDMKNRTFMHRLFDFSTKENTRIKHINTKKQSNDVDVFELKKEALETKLQLSSKKKEIFLLKEQLEAYERNGRQESIPLEFQNATNSANRSKELEILMLQKKIQNQDLDINMMKEQHKHDLQKLQEKHRIEIYSMRNKIEAETKKEINGLKLKYGNELDNLLQKHSSVEEENKKLVTQQKNLHQLQLESTTGKVAKLEEELSKGMTNWSKLQDENENLNRLNISYKSKVESFEKKCSELQSALQQSMENMMIQEEEYNSKLETLRRVHEIETNSNQSIINKHRSQCKILEDVCACLETKCSTLEENFENYKAESTSKLEEYKAKYAECERQCDILNANLKDYDDIKSKCGEYQHKYDLLNDNLKDYNEVKSKCIEYQLKYEQLNAKFEDYMNKSVSNLEEWKSKCDNHEHLQRLSQQWKEKYHESEQNLRTLAIANENLKMVVDSSKKTSAEYEEKCDSLGQRIIYYEEKLKELELNHQKCSIEYKNEFEVKINQVEAELEKYKQKYEESNNLLIAARDKNKSKLEKLDEKCKSLKISLDERKTRCSSLEVSLNLSKSKCVSYEEKCAELETSLETYKSKCAQIKRMKEVSQNLHHFEAKCSELETKLKEQSQKNDQLQEQLKEMACQETLKQTLSESETRCQQLEFTIKGLVSDRAEIEKKYQTQVELLQTENRNLTQEKRRIEKKTIENTEHMKNLLAISQNETHLLNNKVMGMEKELNRFKSQYEGVDNNRQFEEQMKNMVNAHENELERIKTQMQTEANRVVTTYEKKIAAMEKELVSVKFKYTSHENEIADMEREMENKLKNIVNTHEKEMAETKKQMENAMKNMITTHENEIAEVNKEMENKLYILETELKCSNDVNQRLVNSLAELEQNVDETEAERFRTEEANEMLKERLGKATENYLHLVAKYEDMQKNDRNAASSQQDLQKEVKNSLRKVNLLEKTLLELQQEQKTTDKKYKELQFSIKAMEIEKENVTKQCGILKNNCDRLNKHLGLLEKEHCEISNKYKAAVKELDHLKIRHKRLEMSYQEKCTQVLSIQSRNKIGYKVLEQGIYNNTKRSSSTNRMIPKAERAGTKVPAKNRSSRENKKENVRKTNRPASNANGSKQRNRDHQRHSADPLMLLKKKKLTRKMSKESTQKHKHHHSMLLPNTETGSYDLTNISPLSVSLSPAEMDAASLNLLTDLDTAPDHEESDLDRIIKKYDHPSSSSSSTASSIVFGLGGVGNKNSSFGKHGQIQRTTGQRMMNLIITVEKHQRRHGYRRKQEAFSKWKFS